MGQLGYGYGYNLSKDESPSRTVAKSEKGTKPPKPSFNNWEGRGQNGFAVGGYPESGLKPVGTTNKADALRQSIASAGHTADRTRARKSGAATRGY